MTRILFVCMGNICRSPLAEGVLRRMAAEQGVQVDIDSAGTHAYHVGEPPDPRAVAAAQRRGCDISMLRARTVQPGDFDHFDLILAMDNDNLSRLREQAPASAQKRLRLLLSYSGTPQGDVPDPYYGSDNAFEHALDLIERAMQELLAELQPGS